MAAATGGASRRLTFCFDVTCPYAYLASRQVAAVAQAAEEAGGPLTLEWRPTLLGGLYGATAAPQGKHGSASDVMPRNKRALGARGLARAAQRLGIELQFNSRHPIRSLMAMRLLCTVEDQPARARLAHDLYRAYWVEDRDISDPEVLFAIASAHGITDAAQRVEDPAAKETLRDNTDWLVAKGGFGVPTFVVQRGEEERIFFGQDRLFFVAEFFGVPRSHPRGRPLTLLPVHTPAPGAPQATLTFYHDFSSPWSFLGSLQAPKLAAAHGARLVYRPILLGALFRAIGTPNVPMLAIPEVKRAYGSLDMGDWCRWHGGVQLQFPEGFPIRTVLPLRVSIVEPKVVPVLYEAAWIHRHNIGEEAVLRQVLTEAGFNADQLVQAASAQHIKDELKANTDLAEKEGACGVPTFRVDDSEELIWGQDNLNVVSDMLAEANKRRSPRL